MSAYARLVQVSKQPLSCPLHWQLPVCLQCICELAEVVALCRAGQQPPGQHTEDPWCFGLLLLCSLPQCTQDSHQCSGQLGSTVRGHAC